MAIVELRAGETFAGFEVIRKLNAGGMGAVYEVRRVGLERPLALKIMAPEFADSEDHQKRFLREARVASKLESDHVVEVLDANIDPGTRTPWIAMEFLRGEDLAAVMRRRGRLTFAEVLGVYEHVGLGLGQAHRAGVIHLDIKPENLFVSRRHEGATTRVKVLDFGVSRMTAESRVSAKLTSLIASPLWMAPEQGERQGRVTAATDVWALGLVAFYLLTGKYYWRDANVADDEPMNAMAVMMEPVTHPIDPASARAAELGAPGIISAGFDAWFARCVCRDPAARFSDAQATAEALLALGRAAGVTPVVPEPFQGAPAEGGGEGVIVPPTTPAGERAERPWSPTIAAGPMIAATRPMEPTLRPEVTRVHTGSTPFATVAGVGALLAALGVGGFAWWRSQTREEPPITTPTVVAREDRPRPVARPDASTRATPALTCPDGTAHVPGGRFTMGSRENEGTPAERPAHEVEVRGLCVGRTEVTVERYSACVQSGGCTPAAARVEWEGITRADRRFWSGWCNAARADRAQHPINCVDWRQADTYCRWAGGRLPNESEWEYIARGIAGRKWPWGNAPDDGTRGNGADQRYADEAERRGGGAQEHARWDDGYAGTAPVASFSAGRTPEGVDDLAGNVWEWTADQYDRYHNTSAATDDSPSDPGAMYVIRGGGFDEAAERQRAANRSRARPGHRNANLGFRCVFNPPEVR